jgi:NTE family protein
MNLSSRSPGLDIQPRLICRGFAQASRLGLLCTVLLNAACSQFSAVDKPLAHWTPELEQKATAQIRDNRNPELAVLLAFSGGGSRAAAFSYGVLQELAQTNLNINRSSRPLINEIDAISSVSGGSFTAAYYGLYGDRIFTDFEERFLRKDVEGVLLWKLANPINWVRLLSRTYSRADMAANYYDKQLFDQTTLRDLQRPDSPFLIINSTDLATGSRFSFVQQSFDLLCADYGSYPVSRAVAASSAVPVLFSPITLKNYAGSCGYTAPPWIAQALKADEITPLKLEAQRTSAYLDNKQRPWLHLVDGGISDNLGLRGYYNLIGLPANSPSQITTLLSDKLQHILIISVNAQATHRKNWVLERYAPSISEVLGSVTADEMAQYSEDTIELVNAAYAGFAERQTAAGRPITFHFVDVSFNRIVDEGERDYLNSIGTNFDLNAEEVSSLISAGRTVLQQSLQLQEFLKAVSESP